MSIDIGDMDDGARTDFRRANGSPMWYDDEGKNQRGSRPSSWGKFLDDESALGNWKLDKACYGVASAKDLQAAWIAVADDDRAERKRLREAAIQQGRGAEAADYGTALHAQTVRWETDEKFSPPQPYLDALTLYQREMTALGLESVLFEYQVVDEEYRVAGTADRLYRLTKPLKTPNGWLPAGTYVVGDIKTGKSLQYSLPGYAVQMALYSRGRRYDVANDCFFDDEHQYEVNQDWGIIVHLRIDDDDNVECELLWVNLEVGQFGAWLANEIKRWRYEWRRGDHDAGRVTVAETEPEATLIEHHESDGERDTTVKLEGVIELDDWLAWARQRLVNIGRHPEARQWVTLWWPEDLPVPKSIDRIEQVNQLLAHLDACEAQFGLPFPDGDPRAQLSGIHKNDIPPVGTTI